MKLTTHIFITTSLFFGFATTAHAQNDALGTINRPAALAAYGNVQGGLGMFLNTLLNILIAGAGVYALFNFVFAGYAFLNAGSDPNKVADAWKKIYQSIIGLTIAASALVIAALVGTILFGSPTALISPTILIQ